MIVDVTYYHYAPEQYQHVRKVEKKIDDEGIWIVLHFKSPASGQLKLVHASVKTFLITED